jgi:hypothetical protein
VDLAIVEMPPTELAPTSVTAFTESVKNHADGELLRAAPLLSPTPDDSVTLIYADSAEFQ